MPDQLWLVLNVEPNEVGAGYAVARLDFKTVKNLLNGARAIVTLGDQQGFLEAVRPDSQVSYYPEIEVLKKLPHCFTGQLLEQRDIYHQYAIVDQPPPVNGCRQVRVIRKMATYFQTGNIKWFAEDHDGAVLCTAVLDLSDLLHAASRLRVKVPAVLQNDGGEYDHRSH